ncbi:MAG TPA: alkaline phosphatase [Pseudomonadales bacterium]
MLQATGAALVAAAVCAGCATGTADGAPATAASAAAAGGPRNVILFLGDGMGVSTVTAARILAGQQQGGSGEEYLLPYERFPNLALIKTYNTDAQVADSAGTMAAIMTGQKTRMGHISVSSAVPHDDCAAALEGELPTLLELAEEGGFATGVVTTARLTHATPAATYAHVPNREWESDSQLPPAAAELGCRDIARQFVEFAHGDGIEVAFGGGRATFVPKDATDPEHPQVKGIRSDGRNLIEEWQRAHPNGRYVWNQAQFDALSPEDDGPVLGLFEPSHMRFSVERAGDAAGEPSLAEMTAFAIRKLSRNPRGFFLMVEGGRIDHGHHAGNARRALEDAVAMADAVQTALDLTDEANTLILVTADHSHTFTISGYPRRGNPIFGTVVYPDGSPATDTEGRPYTTLGYQNGPGYRETLPDLTSVDTEAVDYLQISAYPLDSETHGGEDVPAYALGPNAEAVRGVMEQNRLFDVMQQALMPDGGLGGHQAGQRASR